MKLIYYIIIRISLVLSVLLTGWAILFYFAVMDEVNDEVDDSLEDYSEIIIIRALAGEELPSKNTASNNQYFLREVTKEYAGSCDDIIYKDKMVDFAIERTHPREVKITVNENMYSSLFQFCVTVSNEYETKKIYVSITPSDRYIFDRITYSLDAYSYTDKQIEERKSIVVNNRGDESIVTNYIFPFKDEHRQIQFTSNNPEAFNLLADSKPEVEIPGIVDGHLVMNGELARYASDMQQLPLPFPDTEKEAVTTPPKTSQRITLLLEYEWFETNFTLYAVHPKTKKEKVITGTLQSKMPKGYFIKSEKLNN